MDFSIKLRTARTKEETIYTIASSTEKTGMDPPIRKGQENPLKRANLLSRLTFWCFYPLISKGYREKLTNDDVCRVDDIQTVKTATATLEREWEKEKKKIANGKGDFRYAIARAFGGRYVLLSSFVWLNRLCQVVQTLLFIHVMSYFEADSSVSETEAYMTAVGIALCSLIQAIMITQIIPYFVMCAMQWQAGAVGLVYKKALKFSAYHSPSTTSGYVLDLLSQDARSMGGLVWTLNAPLTAIVEAVVIFSIAYKQIGVSCFSSVGILMLTWPLQTIMARESSAVRKETSKKQDERVTMVSNMVSGMRVIKMFCWEKPFGQMVQKIRKSEMATVWSTMKWNTVMREMHWFGARMCSAVVIVVCMATENDMTAAKVFPLLALFDILNDQLMGALPHGYRQWKEVEVSCKRIQDYLLTEDVKRIPPNEEWNGVRMKDVTASWHKDGTDKELITLSDINFSVEEGEFATITGPVGSGKSSLFMALLSELPLQKGSISIPQKISYACQQPWIFSSTIRQNILFGSDLDQSKYDKILKVTTLDQDLLKFEHGDLTLVGEKGVTLSGGQKARIGLARALYAEADLYLLDDPLSAVDPAVGRHIFNECIKKYLAGKTRILITHQLQYLKEVDKICVMKNGKLEELAEFEALKVQKNFLTQISMEEKQQKEKEDTTDDKKCAENDEKAEILEEEEQETNSVSLRCFAEYFSAGGSRLFLLFVVILAFSAQILLNGSDFWLAEWTKHEESKIQNISKQDANADDGATNFMSIFLIFTFASFIIGLLRTFTFNTLAINSAINLHHKLYSCVTRAPIRFFDINPKGRIMNRFSSDIGGLSFGIPDSVLDCLKNFINLGGNLFFLLIMNPYLVIILVPVGCGLVVVRNLYRIAQTKCSRLSSAGYSPILTHMGSSMEGIHTIRASGMEKRLIDDFCGHCDFNTSSSFTCLYLFTWFTFLIGFLAAIFNIFACVFCVAMADYYTPSEVGVLMNYIIAMMWCFFDTCRRSVDLEIGMLSVERVLGYSKLDPEADLKTNFKTKEGWPTSGALALENVSMSYKDNERVLKDVSFNIKPGEKVGIVGRTGAGKSSIIQALFRLTEYDGVILYDGEPIKQIGLHDVRSNMSIIPQDPSLFCGTVRSNLDPFEEYSDDVLWRALESVRLEPDIKKLPDGLKAPVTEMGNNLSVGQRQLMCLARATLRRNPLIVLDEATANVDKETDEVIQQIIRRNFSSCTVLTIAHRLNTVIDLDKIIVMDSGKLVEFDKPHALLQNPSGAFTEMVKATGLKEQDRLRHIAKISYENSVNAHADCASVEEDASLRHRSLK